jgi:hypothetical protein
LCLRGDAHATSKDHVDFTHLILIVEIGSMMFALTWLLCHWFWWCHLLAIQKSFALLQIMSCGTMDLTPLLYVNRAKEQSLLLLICRLLLAIPMISTVSTIPAVSTIGCVDLSIVLLFIRGPLAT